MTSMKIGINLGSTIQVRTGAGMDSDWLRPSVVAEISFDEIPSDEELKEKWDWLWSSQVGPQAEQLLEMMIEESSKRRDAIKTNSKDLPEAPVGSVYE